VQGNVPRRNLPNPETPQREAPEPLQSDIGRLSTWHIFELKCRLCPDAAFGNWEDFKRHCDLMEVQPSHDIVLRLPRELFRAC